jgi:hypothetical protein
MSRRGVNRRRNAASIPWSRAASVLVRLAMPVARSQRICQSSLRWRVAGALERCSGRRFGLQTCSAAGRSDRAPARRCRARMTSACRVVSFR